MRVRYVNTQSERLGQIGIAENWISGSFWVRVRFGREYCLIARCNLRDA